MRGRPGGRGASPDPGPGRVGGSEAWREKALEGRNSRRGAGVADGGSPGGDAWTCREEEGSEAGEAGGTERFCRTRSKGNREARPGGRKRASARGDPSRRAERQPIAVRGSRQPRERASVKRAVTRPRAVRSGTPVDDRKGAVGPERGARFPAGETLKERKPRNGERHERRPPTSSLPGNRWEVEQT